MSPKEVYRIPEETAKKNRRTLGCVTMRYTCSLDVVDVAYLVFLKKKMSRVSIEFAKLSSCSLFDTVCWILDSGEKTANLLHEQKPKNHERP